MKTIYERVRLKRDHYQNGVKRKAGSVIKVTQFLAGWLEQNKVATRLNQKKK